MKGLIYGAEGEMGPMTRAENFNTKEEGTALDTTVALSEIVPVRSPASNSRVMDPLPPAGMGEVGQSRATVQPQLGNTWASTNGDAPVF